MKKLIIILLILINISCYSQQKKADSLQAQNNSLPDSVFAFTLGDIQELDANLRKTLTLDEQPIYKSIMEWVWQRAAIRIREQKKKK